MPKEVQLLKGGSFTDARGTLNFVNDFDFYGVKRFYQIIHDDASVVRAWQAHRVEHKYFYASAGSFAIAWVAIDNWDAPSVGLSATHTILSASDPLVLSIPPGYANGIKALIPGSVLTIFSDLTLQESEDDRWSFQKDYWFDWSKFK